MSNVEDEDDGMRDEYDFSNAVRTTKYADRYANGTNLVLLEPDVYKAFPDSESVNEALRLILRAAEKARQEG
jgi:hypothetical protein